MAIGVVVPFTGEAQGHIGEVGIPTPAFDLSSCREGEGERKKMGILGRVKLLSPWPHGVCILGRH